MGTGMAYFSPCLPWASQCYPLQQYQPSDCSMQGCPGQLVMYYLLLIKHTQYHIRPWTMDPAYVEHVCTTIYNNKFVKASFFFPKIIVESTHMHTLYINVSFDIICIVFHYIGQECFCKRFSSLLEHQCWKAIWGEVFSCEYTPEWSTGFKKGLFFGGGRGINN